MKTHYRVQSFDKTGFLVYLKGVLSAKEEPTASPYELLRYRVPFTRDIPEESEGLHIVYKTAKSKLSFSSDASAFHYEDWLGKED